MCQRQRAHSFTPFAFPLSGDSIRFLCLSFAVAVGLVVWRIGFVAHPLETEPRAVCIDRDGDRLVFLGEAGRLLGELPAVAPVFACEAPPLAQVVSGEPDHWVIEATERRAGGAHALCRVSATGRRRELARVPGPVHAAPGVDEVWLLAGRPEERWLWRVSADAGKEVERLLPLPGAKSLAVGRSEVLVASSGALSVFERSGAPVLRRERAVGDAIGGLAACAGGWWAFFEEAGELWHLDRELRAVRVHVVGQRALWLGALDGRAALFETDPRGAPVLRTYSTHGTVEVSPPIYLSGVRAVAQDREGELLLATHGAVLGLDQHLTPVWSQGGFAWLAGFARGRPRSSR